MKNKGISGAVTVVIVIVIVAAAAVGGYIIMSGGKGGTGKSAGGWPMFGHDPRNTSHTTASGATDNTMKWKFKTGGSIYSSPAVVNGTVYVRSDDGYLYAVDADSGEKVWKFKPGYYNYHSPLAVVNGTVYI